MSENSMASGLLRGWWSTVTDDSYEAYKDTLFGKDERGLSSQLVVNTENESNGYAIYTRKLSDQELSHIQVNWNTAADNMRDEQAPVPWTISVDVLKENYLTLMDVTPETVCEEPLSSEEWQPTEESQSYGDQPVENDQPSEEKQWSQEVAESTWSETNAGIQE